MNIYLFIYYIFVIYLCQKKIYLMVELPICEKPLLAYVQC